MSGRVVNVTALWFLLIATACGDGASDISLSDASSVSTGSASAPAATTPLPGPLFLGVSIHVEGWSEEAQNEAQFDRHADTLLMMAEEASRNGAVFTFEFSEVFLDAAIKWESDVVTRLHELGQASGIHADVGGSGDPTLDELVRPLRRMRAKAESLRVDVRHVSGICSTGPWVEAALEAGFLSTNGAVEYCALSLDAAAVPEGWDLSGCTSPAVCHGQLQVEPEARIHPFLVDSSADFLTPANGGLVLMIGNSGEAVDCAAEASTGGRCVGDEADLPHAADLLETFLEERDPGKVAALTMSWSVGSPPSQEFVSAFLSVFAGAVSRGEARWAGNGDIGAVARGSLRAAGG